MPPTVPPGKDTDAKPSSHRRRLAAWMLLLGLVVALLVVAVSMTLARTGRADELDEIVAVAKDVEQAHLDTELSPRECQGPFVEPRVDWLAIKVRVTIRARHPDTQARTADDLRNHLEARRIDSDLYEIEQPSKLVFATCGGFVD